MGSAASKKAGYQELRDSIPGSFVPDNDFELFYSLCKVESARTISTLLHPNPSQLFYVVISGEVHVQLTGPELKQQKSVTATVFTPGETIHFFNLTMRTGNVTNFDFGECVRNGEIKLALHFKNHPKSAARVIGIDRKAYDQFAVSARSNVHQLTTFLGLNIVDLVGKSPFFKTITPEQASVFGPLLKVRLSQPGKLLSPYTSEMAQVNATSPKHGSPRAGRRDPQQVNNTPCGPIALLLSGTSLSVPYGPNLAPLALRLAAASPSDSVLTKHGRPTLLASLNKPIFRSPVSAPVQPIYYPNLAEKDQAADSDNTRSQQTMHPGLLLGLLEYYCRNPRVVLRAYMAASHCTLGYLDISTLDALFAVDPRFNRVLRRNYYMLIMSFFKPTVPLLRDMDEWSFALLSCKVSIRCFLTDTAIYRKGDNSDYAYIIMGGSVREVSEPASMKRSNSGGILHGATAGTPTIERTLRWGALFGEVALATNSPYFSSTITREPSMLLAISKRVLDQIYNNNKAKLCEIRIRLMGNDVSLNHVIDHPRGAELFLQYLAKEHAAENLQFYCAVDKFDTMCREVKKQYLYIMKVREENIVAIEGARQPPTVKLTAVSLAGSKNASPANAARQVNPPPHEVQAGQPGAERASPPKSAQADGDAKSDEHQAELTSQDHSELGSAPSSNPALSTSYSNISAAGADADAGPGPRDSFQNMGYSQPGSFMQNTDFSRPGSFMQDDVSSGKTGTIDSSNRSTVHSIAHYYTLSKPGSIDISQLQPDDVNSSKSSNFSMRSYESQRSVESNISDTFIAMHLEAAASAADAAGHGHGSFNASAGNKAPSHGHWGAKAPMKKPALESIISESNFSHLDDLDDPEMDGQKKFSLKSKPQSVSAYAYSGKNSSKIALIEEGENEEEGPDSRGSPVPTSRVAPGAGAAGGAGAGAGQVVEGNAYSAANLKKALQIAVSIAESVQSGEGTPKETSTATAPAASTGAGQNSPSKLSLSMPSPQQYAVFPTESSPHSPHAHGHGHGSVLNKTDSIDMDYGHVPGYYRGGSVDGDNQSVGTWNTLGQDSLLAQNQQLTTSATDAASVTAADRKHANHIAHKINKQLHKVQKDVAELKEVARSIMQMYVLNGADNQLNLPGTLRMRTEAAFDNWTTMVLSGSSNASALSLADGVVDAAGKEAAKEGAKHAPLSTDIVSTAQRSATAGAGVPVLHRTDSFDAEPEPGALPEIDRRQLSSVTKLSSLSSQSYNTSYGEGLLMNKLEYTKDSPEFRASTHFASSFQSDGPSTATTPGAIFGTSTSIRTSLIPAPIHIPELKCSEPILHLLSDSTTPGAVEQQLQQGAKPAHTNSIPFSGAGAQGGAAAGTGPDQDHGASAGSVTGAGGATRHDRASIVLDPEYTSIDFIDMGFVELFREAKQEILKLLRDDKFPRWKATREFQAFITGIKPYEKERNSGSNDSKEKGSDKDKSINSSSLER